MQYVLRVGTRVGDDQNEEGAEIGRKARHIFAKPGLAGH